jgi:trehalose 6-phosphate phosphatase
MFEVPMSASPPPLHADAGVFLDVDGTLLDITATPVETRVDAQLRTLLQACAQRLGGALALVSGRSLEQIDALFAPLRLPAAGLHGLERRSGDRERRALAPDPALDGARLRLEEFVAAHPGTLLEDKRASLALHVRLAPRFTAAAQAAIRAELATLGSAYALQPGKCVFEIKPAGASKVHAIEEFLAEPPFAGRMPIFAGDDHTDAAAIGAVAARGGIGIAVGEGIEGPYRLADPKALRRWLRDFVAATD